MPNHRVIRLLLAAILVVFIVLPSVHGQAQDADYLRILALIEEADTLASKKSSEALTKYREAQTALQRFQKTYANWNAKLIEYRLNYVASKIEAAQTNVPGVAPAHAAGALFPKMPPAPKAFVVECQRDSESAKMTAWALQGLINQQSAEVYVLSVPWSKEQLDLGNRPFEVLPRLLGADAGLRTLFQKYHGHVKKLFVYDREKEWTWYLALMSGAQQQGIPVTESQREALTTEFGWKGDVEDFRNRWATRIEAYDWAILHLMPNCSTQVVFALRKDMPLTDYVVASKGFVFWLNFKNNELTEVKKIFQSGRYGLGTSLMGYANIGDEANATANRYGIGYVVSDFYANGSFWSSFPNKTYTQSRGKVLDAQPGKIYAHIMWSDGDNIMFDQNPLYMFWHDAARGAVPVATQMSPTLQELNSPLLDWYYAKLTENDELVCGPTGFQFIFIRDFRDDLFPGWCRLTRDWCERAGFHSARIWIGHNPSFKYTTYMTTCGFDGILGEGWRLQGGHPPKIDTFGAKDEDELYRQFLAVKPDSNSPVFCGFTCIVGGFNKAGGGFSAVKRQVDHIHKTHPGRYEFVLPKDQFATLRALYYSDRRERVGRPHKNEGLRAVKVGDGEFAIVERDGSRCWLARDHDSGRDLYFDVDDRFVFQPGAGLEIELEYLDAGTGEIVLEYDSPSNPYKKHPYVVRRTNSSQWRTARFRINDAHFAGRQNASADFRFFNGRQDLLVRVVRLKRIGP